jgi:hypothetical protein
VFNKTKALGITIAILFLICALKYFALFVDLVQRLTSDDFCRFMWKKLIKA